MSLESEKKRNAIRSKIVAMLNRTWPNKQLLVFKTCPVTANRPIVSITKIIKLLPFLTKKWCESQLGIMVVFKSKVVLQQAMAPMVPHPLL